MSASPPPELYIGYLRSAPPGIARFVRRAVLWLLAGAAGLAAWIAVAQAPLGAGVFEYGVGRTFDGVVRLDPYPRLEIERPGERPPAVLGASDYLLVAFGKHGARSRVGALDGRRARIEGSLIYRGGDTMVEITEAAAADGDGSAPRPVVDLGTVTVRGEIVDSKCYLGVMKPGRGKSHRACAALCIRGGIPPVLIVRTTGGETRHLLLVDPAMRSVNERVLDHVAEPLEITGRLLGDGETWMLAADPGGFRRLDSAP